MLKPSLPDLIKSATRSILKNKGRTILTSLGIIIGVTSVLLLTSIGNGLKIYINNQFESIGSNTIFIVPGKIFDDKGNFNQGGGASARFISTSFDDKDMTALRRDIKNIITFPINISIVEVKYRNTIKKNITLVGTTDNYGKELNSLPKSDNGVWFTKEDNDKKSDVIVLGHQIAIDLFGTISPLNKKIIVNSKNFKVIGVIDKKGGSFGGPDQDNYLYAPFKTVTGLTGNDKIQEIVIKANNKNEVDPIKKSAKTVMLKRYKEDAFSVFDSSQLLNSINSIIGTLTIALSGIAAISLLVGGIGIMNIMLVTVSERTKEIGLRKAIGAYPQAILVQFLIEAVILSSIGGFIGLLLGWLGTLLINNFFPAQVTLTSIILAVGVSFGVGVIFGVAPAQKASKLSPIEALRYE